MTPSIDKSEISLLSFKEKYRRYEQTVIMMADNDIILSFSSEDLLYSITQDLQDLCYEFYKATGLSLNGLNGLNNANHIKSTPSDFAFTSIWNSIVSNFQLQYKQLNINNRLFSSYYKTGYFSPFMTIIYDREGIGPLWYSLFHDKLMNRNRRIDTYIMQAILEALGAFFIILLYIEYLPNVGYINQEQPTFLLTNKNFNFCFYSLIFEATYLHPFFISFSTPLSNDSLTGLRHLSKALFIVKDSPHYIILQCRRNERNLQQLIDDIQSNTEFTSFLSTLPSKVRRFYPIQNLLTMYSYGRDLRKRTWARRMISLITSVTLNYFSTWDKQNMAELHKLGFSPEVFLNVYRRGTPLYNYDYLNEQSKLSSDDFTQ